MLVMNKYKDIKRCEERVVNEKIIFYLFCIDCDLSYPLIFIA